MKTQSGFTLTELMVVITIVAILMAMGVPSYKYVTTANRISAEANGLLGDMQYARSEAIREGSTITVCASNDGQNCNGGAADTWQGGWIVFSDANADKTVQGNEPILRRQNAFASQDTLTSTVNAVTFNREGFAKGLPNAIQLTLHDSTSNVGYTRCLDINIVGSVKVVAHSTDSTCT